MTRLSLIPISNAVHAKMVSQKPFSPKNIYKLRTQNAMESGSKLLLIRKYFMARKSFSRSTKPGPSRIATSNAWLGKLSTEMISQTKTLFAAYSRSLIPENLPAAFTTNKGTQTSCT
jgi:hypothetical protein